MPKIEIVWDSAGHRDQDESLAEEIVDHAMKWLDGYDGDASTDLGYDRYALLPEVRDTPSHG